MGVRMSGLPSWARYDYLYGEDELREWVERLLAERSASGATFVIANNHHDGQAVANALELKAALQGSPVDVPDTVLATFPRLARIARRSGQGRLF